MRRILFVKTSSLGDVVHHCPAVSDAARALPGATIDWAVEEAFAGVVGMHRAVRRVIPVAMRRWRRALWRPQAWSEIGALRRALRAERYDAVIDTQSLLKSALIASLANGTKHGLDRASAREPLAAPFYDLVHTVPKGMHAVERNRMLTALALGYPVPSPAGSGRLEFGLEPAGEAAPEERPAVFLTMTSRSDKLWPEDCWIELGRALAANVVLPWGSEAERNRAERIGQALGRATVPSRMALPGLGDLFRKASCVVGLDTGLTHLAAALGARTVGVYCGSDPALTGLHGSPNAVNLGSAGDAPSVAQVLKALA